MSDLNTFLRGMPAFERFNDRQIDVLASQLVLEQHPSGTTLLAQGEQGRALFIIMAGTISVERRAVDADEEEHVTEMYAGEIVGRLSLVPDMPALTSCRALSEVTVAALSPEHYNALFLLAPAIAHQLQYMVAARLAQDLQIKNQMLRKRLGQPKSAKTPSLLERIFGV